MSFSALHRTDCGESSFFGGDAAKDEYRKSLSRSFDDDATGGVFGYFRFSGGVPGLVKVTKHDDVRLDVDAEDFEMIIIDSGNSVGDAWKYIFHPMTETGIFIQETL